MNQILHHRARGFTLTELMVTVAIIGILTAIALPMYSRYVDNTRLTQAHTVLTEAQQTVQRELLKEGSLDATKLSGILSSTAVQGRLNENNLLTFFTVESNIAGGRYYFYALPRDNAKKGVYVDNSGKAYKCTDKAATKARTAGKCEAM